jgi:hypothetical protein
MNKQRCILACTLLILATCAPTLQADNTKANLQLLYAAIKGDRFAASYALGNRADINYIHPTGEFPLKYAAFRNDVDMLIYLCNNKALVDLGLEDNNSALLAAFYNGSWRAVCYLIKKGATITDEMLRRIRCSKRDDHSHEGKVTRYACYMVHALRDETTPLADLKELIDTAENLFIKEGLLHADIYMVFIDYLTLIKLRSAIKRPTLNNLELRTEDCTHRMKQALIKKETDYEKLKALKQEAELLHQEHIKPTTPYNLEWLEKMLAFNNRLGKLEMRLLERRLELELAKPQSPNELDFAALNLGYPD